MDCEHCKEVGWEGTRHRLYPKWEPGDRLWVRETFQEVPATGGCEWKHPSDGYTGVRYRATWDRSHSCCWKPSIHMPRWASRITLEINDVRVQRLQEISEEDAIAEGAQCAGFPASLTNYGAFGRLWQKINGPDSWSANPFVWAISFKRI